MANYSITINSKFKPFSFERYIQPYVMYGDYFSKLEDTLAAYETEADKVKTLANQASDPVSYAKYQAYSNYLTDQMNDLYENGATVLNRQGLLNAKRRYNSDIAPIISAANYRREMRTKQRELRDKDPNLRFDNDFENVSIDDLVNNPDMGYRSISGGDVANMAATYVANIAKGIMSEPEYEQILNGAFYRKKIQQGFTVDQAFAEALQQSGKELTEKDIENINKLRTIRENIHNIYQNNPAYNREWANPFINIGISSGIGATAYDEFGNPDHMTPYQSAQLDISRDENEREWGKYNAWKEDRELLPVDQINGLNVYQDPKHNYQLVKIDSNGKKTYLPGTGGTTYSNSSSGSSGSATNRNGILSTPISVAHTRNDIDIADGVADWSTKVYKKGTNGESDNFELTGTPISYNKLGPATKKRLAESGVTEETYNYYVLLDQVDKSRGRGPHDSNIIVIPKHIAITGNSATSSSNQTEITNTRRTRTNPPSDATVTVDIEDEYGPNIEGSGDNGH